MDLHISDNANTNSDNANQQLSDIIAILILTLCIFRNYNKEVLDLSFNELRAKRAV